MLIPFCWGKRLSGCLLRCLFYDHCMLGEQRDPWDIWNAWYLLVGTWWAWHLKDFIHEYMQIIDRLQKPLSFERIYNNNRCTCLADSAGWPLLPVNVPMQKCEKCNGEYYSPINFRRHMRIHHRLKKHDKVCFFYSLSDCYVAFYLRSRHSLHLEFLLVAEYFSFS